MKLMSSIAFKIVVIGYMILAWLRLMPGIDVIVSTIYFAILLAFVLGVLDAYREQRRENML